MKAKRKPKYRGFGIYMHQQFEPKTLVKGDTCFDADFGPLLWNGKEWVSQPSK